MTELPRAASTDRDDRRYNPSVGHPGLLINVWLDGVLQVDVDTYDMDEGFIMRAVLHEDGGIQAEPGRPGHILRERADGVVTVALVAQPD